MSKNCWTLSIVCIARDFFYTWLYLINLPLHNFTLQVNINNLKTLCLNITLLFLCFTIFKKTQSHFLIWLQQKQRKLGLVKMTLISSLNGVLLQFHDELRYDTTCFLLGVFGIWSYNWLPCVQPSIIFLPSCNPSIYA